MGLNQLFDKNLVFCLQADNQEHLFNQVANLLEERKIVTPSYRTALIEREKSFPTGLDMEFLGKDLPNVAIPHTDIEHNLAEKVVVVRLNRAVTFHNMIAPDKEVEVSLLRILQNLRQRFFHRRQGFQGKMECLLPHTLNRCVRYRLVFVG